ncbi:hypothetical protein BDV39DRAFT_170473 [Aspergillus sergii]|uniref:Uncharacterized protein n=1 Tax=Aspergillus sergii TaxID=1034303 RepID=A0A5N6XAN4_9EURO|nr:hypothetical protein BDV39DRAFT_170473 [Aspergillus sergii]
MVTAPMGQAVAGAEKRGDIVYALLNPQTIKISRMGIPITCQRRHDAYPDRETCST